MSRSHLVLAPILGIVTLTLAGCGSRDPVAEVPGHLQPGNAIGVAQQALGQGNGSTTEGLTIGSQPVVNWSAPNVPVMQDGQVDVMYFPARESLDGEAERDDYYVYVKVAEQSFTRAHARQDKSLLNSEETVSRADLTPSSQRLTDPHRGEGSDGPDLPYSQSGKSTTKVSVVEVDPSRGTTNVVGTQSVPSTSVPSDMSKANKDDVMRMLDNFNALQRQRQTPSPGTTTLTPAGGLTPPSGTALTPATPLTSPTASPTAPPTAPPSLGSTTPLPSAPGN